jgi:hypothetical protein
MDGETLLPCAGEAPNVYAELFVPVWPAEFVTDRDAFSECCEKDAVPLAEIG